MGGLDNLAELKVLNLAGNQIRKISNMQGLISLEELNIRRNRIRSTTGLVSTTLEKLFISNNELQVYLFFKLFTYLSTYRIFSYSFRGNYCFLNFALFTVTFDLYFINLNSCRRNYQGRKLFAEIRYLHSL